MAKSVNKTFLLGRVGKAPQIGSTSNGTPAANFSLATNDRQKDYQSNWTDRTEWHNIVAYGRTAEIVRDYVGKGSQLFIQGKLQTRSWDDQATGLRHYRTEVFVIDLTLLGEGRGENMNSDSGPGSGRDEIGRAGTGSDYQRPAPDVQYSDEELDASDIPF